MPPLARRLPSPAALLAFEAAARNASFTRAAAELNVTQAAVSRQIRNLEHRLGVRLFLRAHRAVELTSDGLELHQAVTMGLEHIARMAAELEQRGGGEEIAIAATNAFASFWLMPRIATFRAANPGIAIRVVTQDHFADPAGEGVDLAIRYGHGNWRRLAARHLFDERIFPVCSPAALGAMPCPPDPARLLEETLLVLDAPQDTWIDWPRWLEYAGIPGRPKRTLRFNNYTILLQAALDGQGVALGWGRIVADLVQRGHLVRIMEHAMPAEHAYYLVHAEDRALARGAERLSAWILREANELASYA